MKTKLGGKEFVINIFVEGNGDEKFLKDFIEVHFGEVFGENGNVKIIITGGKDKISDYKKRFADDETNLVIFDADYPRNDGGFAVRNQEFTDLKNDLGINFESFLFPNNDDDGDLETLLENIINPTNKPVLDCWND